VIDFRPYWQAWETRLRQGAVARATRVAARTARARAVLAEIARVLIERYGARQVTLFGSLARGDFGEDSDIDLVVDGLPAHLLFAAGAEAERLAGDIAVDLVPAEAASERARAALHKEGIVLLGRA